MAVRSRVLAADVHRPLDHPRHLHQPARIPVVARTPPAHRSGGGRAERDAAAGAADGSSEAADRAGDDDAAVRSGTVLEPRRRVGATRGRVLARRLSANAEPLGAGAADGVRQPDGGRAASASADLHAGRPVAARFVHDARYAADGGHGASGDASVRLLATAGDRVVERRDVPRPDALLREAVRDRRPASRRVALAVHRRASVQRGREQRVVRRRG